MLRKINKGVKPGEIQCLMAESGKGKSMYRTIEPGVSDEAVALITASLLKRNITSFTIRPGSNGAVWVSHGRCDCYYIIRDGKIKDVIYD